MNATSDNYWQTETIKAIGNMFDEQVDTETIKAIFEQNEHDIERTVDAILVHLTAVETKKKEEEKRSKTIADLLEFEEIPEEIEVSQVSQSEVDYSQPESISIKESTYSESLASSGSVNNSVLIYEEKPDFNLSEMETQTEYTVASPEEKTVQTEADLLSPDLRRFQERMEELSFNLSEAKLAKIRVEEEKKNAMKWCVTEMESLRGTISEKDRIILQQQEEIQQLTNKLAQNKPQPQEDGKLDKFIVESKQMIVTGVQNLSQQLSENINKIQKEFKKADDKEWLVVEKLKEFAADFRREIAQLFNEPIPSPFKKSPKSIPIPVPSPRETQLASQLAEERQTWENEKSRLRSYILELECQIQVYQDRESHFAAVKQYLPTLQDLSSSEQKDIELIMSQANVSVENAISAYLNNKKDVINAIMECTM